VANKMILECQLEALRGLVDGVVVVVGYMQDRIRETFGENRHGMPITYIEQTEPRGTGHAILQCAGVIDGPFLAMNGDDLFDPQDLATLEAAKTPAALVKSVPDPRLYGVYEVTDGNRVVRLVEKPKDAFSKLANIGAYRFTPDVFRVLATTPPSERGEIEITSAIQSLAEHGDFCVVESRGYWLPIGYPWHLLDANAYMLENQLEHDVQGEVSPAAYITGTVGIGRGTVIRSGVAIDGPVLIGENCTIGPNCWLRPGVTIGNGCRVGQGSELKNSILMDGAATPHQNYVGDSIIGEKANLGCGTVTANVRHDRGNVMSMVKGELVDTGRRKFGAVIGDHVHTGIHTSIYPGRKLWPHTGTRPGEQVQRDITNENL